MTSHNLTAPTDPPPPIIRCKTCRVPLPDAAWKNCDRCRRKRTESHHRWKQSQSRWNALRAEMNSSTPSQGPGTARPVHNPNGSADHRGNPAGSSRPANDQPRTTPASSSAPHPQVVEYQTSDELLDALSVVPPCSRFIGKFSVVADPAVNNPMRARMFVDQLRARATPMSNNSQPTSLTNPNTGNSYALVFSCTCQEACWGRLIVSVDDDTSHPFGVPGQRIGAVVLHPNLPG